MIVDPALLREVEIKRSEMGGATTKAVLIELMKDAARAHKLLVFAATGENQKIHGMYPFRIFSRSLKAHHFAFCERLLNSIEQAAPGQDIVSTATKLVTDFGAKASRIVLPTPAEARRLRLVTAILPPLIPEANRGTAANQAMAWRVLWLIACGGKATKIAEGLKRENGTHVKRNQVWRIRDKLYDALAATVDAARDTACAA